MKQAFNRHRELILFLAIVFITAAAAYGVNQWWNATYVQFDGAR